MSDKIEGRDESLWTATTPRTDYPELSGDDTVYDLAVVGGGITGIVAAYHAQRRGLRTVLIDKARLAEWTTGGTTAKLTSQHYLIYDHLIARHGKDVAQAYADANQRGIDKVEAVSAELGIDCEFSRRDAFVYSRREERIPELRAEVEAAVSLGLPASFETQTELPFDIAGAVKFSGQAQFHPRKFLLPLAEDFRARGGVIYEQTKATDITPGAPHILSTEKGELQAQHVLQASGEPFWRRDLFDGFMWLKMSYALAVQLKEGNDYPAGMYVTTEEPMRTIRTAYYKDSPVLVFGGESHEYDDDTFDMDARHRTLIEDVRERYDVEQVLYRWLAGDYMPYDRMPYIGALPGHRNIHVITGYRAWGLAWALSAAEAVVAGIAGAPEDWVAPFSPERLAEPIPESERTHGF